MSTPVQLDAQPRTVIGKGVGRLRRDGILPATIYGKDREPLAIQLDEKLFNTIYTKVGNSVLVNLQVEGKESISAFIHGIQRHPVSRDIIHADFRAVDAERQVRVNVNLLLKGISPVVARGDAIVNKLVSAVRVRAYPQQLPPAIVVDMTRVVRVSQLVQVKDLPTSDSYTIEADPELILMALTPIKRRN